MRSFSGAVHSVYHVPHPCAFTPEVLNLTVTNPRGVAGDADEVVVNFIFMAYFELYIIAV